jgi:tetratricopeptide (TPR) repeat protein
MSRERDRPPTGDDSRSWQRLVWARIAFDRLWRSGWPRGSASNTVAHRRDSMSEGNRRASTAALERPRRLRPPWRRRLAGLATAVAACAVIIWQSCDIGVVDPRRECEVAQKASQINAVEVCQRAFRRTQDASTGVRLANALYARNEPGAARRLAILQLATSARSDALYLLGRIAYEEDRYEHASAMLELARILHHSEGEPRKLALDNGLLASVRTDLGEFGEALRLLDECITKMHELQDRSVEIYCRLAAVRTLVRVGYFEATAHEMEAAKPLASSEDEHIDLDNQRGNIAQETGAHPLAVEIFKTVLGRSERSTNTIRTINANLNIAYSLAELGQVDEAQRYVDNAAIHDTDNMREKERAWASAQIAYRQGELIRASLLTEKYFDLLDPKVTGDLDDQIDVAVLAARIELDRNDLGSARRWAERAVKLAERVRGAQSELELRPWVLAKRRVAHELLFTALARDGQVEDAVLVFNEWQGRTVQDALSRPRPAAPTDRAGIANQISELSRWLSAVSHSAFARRADRDAVLSTLRKIDLVALIVANDDVWLLSANHGPPRLSRLATLTEIEARIGLFRDSPTASEQLASALGRLLLPKDVFRRTRDTLHVLVDSRLGALPVPALRRGNTPLIQLRPVARVLRLPETHCVHVSRSGHATVLAAPKGNLLNARIEGELVAQQLRTTSKAGIAATRAALFAAASDSVLHIAGHGVLNIDAAAIPLEDGDVSALEISARQVAPSLVVLSACNAATSPDLELAGSLAAGFLAAGSQHVLATLHSVSDAGAREVSTRFYAESGVADPARALAAVQSALAEKSDNTDWPHFTVFGPDVCPTGTPEPP